MLAVVAVAGFALGIAITATIAALLNLATPETRGTANSLRIMGNRAGQLVIPFSVGLVAAATGAAGIFVIIGAEPCGLDRGHGDAEAEAGLVI